MIKINCPQCNEQLEVDVGFAGGICRCFECGTLMTVPARTGGKAEQLKRSARPARPARPGEPTPEPVETFVTSTGTELNVTAEQMHKIVVANKARMRIRAGVIVAFIAIFGLIGAAIVMISIHLLDEAKQQQQQQFQNQVAPDGGVAIPSVPMNPLLMTEPNVLGLDMAKAGTGLTQIVLDGSITMARSVPFVAEALIAGLPTLPGDMKVQVQLARDSQIEAVPQQPTLISRWDHAGFKARMDKLEAHGSQALAQAIERATGSTPDRLILIFYQKPALPVMTQVQAAVEKASATLFIVKLGRDEPDLAELTARFGGTYLNISDGQMDLWLNELKGK